MTELRKFRINPLPMMMTLICVTQTALAQVPSSPAADLNSSSALDAPVEMQSVAVSGIKDPEIRSYRSMVAGAKAFDKYRNLAPNAPELRFRLSPVSNNSDLDLKTLLLQIRGDKVAITIPVASDGTFSLPRNQDAEEENADLILNKRRGQLRGRPDVRSIGVPTNMRRLGDLRLECEVNFAIAKYDMNFFERSAIATATLGRGVCQSKMMHMGFPAKDTITGITLVSAERRVSLAPGMPRFSGKHFFPPLGDQDWPDDTLVEFKFEHADLSPDSASDSNASKIPIQ